MRRFQFLLSNLSNLLKTFFQPSANLINTDTGTEEISTVLTQQSEQEAFKENIEKYINLPIRYFISKSYFLYDKRDIIKEAIITALNKKNSIYRCISYANNKTENEIFKIISPENLLKFLVNKDANKDSLTFQLTSISGNLPTLKDKKTYNLSLRRIERKKKLSMQEPIEMVIIRAQQKFEIAGGLNPIQIEIGDDRIMNMLKKHKNAVYKLTLLETLFPESIKNNTGQVFITCRELNDIKKN